MLPPLPQCSRRAPNVAQTRPSISAFPEMGVGSACTSTFSRIAQRSLTLRPAHSHGHLRDRHPGASDISSPPCLPRLLPAGAIRRVGLAPTRKRRLCTAHPIPGRSEPLRQILKVAVCSCARVDRLCHPCQALGTAWMLDDPERPLTSDDKHKPPFVHPGERTSAKLDNLEGPLSSADRRKPPFVHRARNRLMYDCGVGRWILPGLGSRTGEADLRSTPASGCRAVSAARRSDF